MAVGSVAKAISEGFKLIRQIRETSVIRKLRKCVDCGEKYIQVNEKEGEFDHINDEQQEKKLRYYHKRFFRLNN